MTFPIYGKIRFMFQTTNQLYIYIYTFSVNVRITMENQHAIVMLLYNLRNPLFLSPFFNSKQFVYQLNYIYIYIIYHIYHIYIYTYTYIYIYILLYIYIDIIHQTQRKNLRCEDAPRCVARRLVLPPGIPWHRSSPAARRLANAPASGRNPQAGGMKRMKSREIHWNPIRFRCLYHFKDV